ncbi:MAG: hypothetical protein V1921_00315 [Candidatus Altiarchaeota archaeon]
MDGNGGMDKSLSDAIAHFEGEELLSLLLEVNRIPQSSAVTFLNQTPDTIEAWALALETQGWIKKRDPDVEDPILEISASGMKKIEALQKNLIKFDEVEEKDDRKKSGVSLKKLFGKLFLMDRVLLLDILILISMFASFYLIWRFFEDPNRETVSFLVSMILFSLIVLTYKSYEELSKAKKIRGFFVVVYSTIAEILKRRKQHILGSMLLLITMYYTGLYLNHRITLYFGMGVLSLSTYILLYQPRSGLRKNVMFYVGMLILCSSLLLIAGVERIVFPISNKTYRIIDILIGLLGLAVVKFNEKYFGVNIERFREFSSEE